MESGVIGRAAVHVVRPSLIAIHFPNHKPLTLLFLFIQQTHFIQIPFRKTHLTSFQINPGNESMRVTR
uniref:Uncharacterized protein n=1 Tax=Cucumis melo TaxID=3656 RepID=A0A9I9EF41_CUCME